MTTVHETEVETTDLQDEVDNSLNGEPSELRVSSTDGNDDIADDEEEDEEEYDDEEDEDLEDDDDVEDDDKEEQDEADEA